MQHSPPSRYEFISDIGHNTKRTIGLIDLVDRDAIRIRRIYPISSDNVCNKDPRGSQNYTEYFAGGTVPSSSCNHHISLEVCSESGMPVALYCPESETYVYFVDGSKGTQDSKYLANEAFMKKTCTLHRKPPVEEEHEEDVPDDTDPGIHPTPEVPDAPTPDNPTPETPIPTEPTMPPMNYLYYSKYQLVYSFFRPL